MIFKGGKHVGKRIEDVIREDPSYILYVSTIWEDVVEKLKEPKIAKLLIDGIKHLEKVKPSDLKGKFDTYKNTYEIIGYTPSLSRVPKSKQDSVDLTIILSKLDLMHTDIKNMQPMPVESEPEEELTMKEIKLSDLRKVTKAELLLLINTIISTPEHKWKNIKFPNYKLKISARKDHIYVDIDKG